MQRTSRRAGRRVGEWVALWTLQSRQTLQQSESEPAGRAVPPSACLVEEQWSSASAGDTALATRRCPSKLLVACGHKDRIRMRMGWTRRQGLLPCTATARESASLRGGPATGGRKPTRSAGGCCRRVQWLPGGATRGYDCRTEVNPSARLVRLSIRARVHAEDSRFRGRNLKGNS